MFASIRACLQATSRVGVLAPRLAYVHLCLHESVLA